MGGREEVCGEWGREAIVTVFSGATSLGESREGGMVFFDLDSEGAKGGSADADFSSETICEGDLLAVSPDEVLNDGAGFDIYLVAQLPRKKQHSIQMPKRIFIIMFAI
ncbi:MAG: hypothetical protein LWW94_04010 [Candidatus Desulfofervidaceae bacterium]|nr:hypothetical protein [Candidatus Desulfofervidaceae bacterium]